MHYKNIVVPAKDELLAAKIPNCLWDNCVSLLIPLNKCRKENYYLPWTCNEEKHTYEKCQYERYIFNNNLK